MEIIRPTSQVVVRTKRADLYKYPSINEVGGMGGGRHKKVSVAIASQHILMTEF